MVLVLLLQTVVKLISNLYLLVHIKDKLTHPPFGGDTDNGEDTNGVERSVKLFEKFLEGG